LPAARLYFAVDRDELPADTGSALGEVVAYLQAHPSARARVSGFHDPTGDPIYNEDLAQRRAAAVRGALEAAGVSRSRIELVRPTATMPGGPHAEARRVEVSVAP
jgi:K(+)-stimulated pyrophosphate-energized sodium pump